MVRDLWALRQLAAVADDIGRDASEGFEPSEYLGERFADVDKIRAALLDRERSSTTAGTAGAAVVAKIEATLKGTPDPLPCIGIPRLDDELGGCQPSTLIVESARPGVGKSLFGIEACDNMVRDGFGCAYFSLEMSGHQVASRIIASRLERDGLRVPFRDVLRGTVHHSVAERVASIAHDMRADPLWIEEAGGVTIGEIAATAERRMNGFARKGVPLGGIFVDHAHKVVSARRDTNGEAVVREVSGGALALAKRLGVPLGNPSLHGESPSATERRAHDEPFKIGQQIGLFVQVRIRQVATRVCQPIRRAGHARRHCSPGGARWRLSASSSSSSSSCGEGRTGGATLASW
jgi:replicative DNA helicase